jgi:hypothetical protein
VSLFGKLLLHEMTHLGSAGSTIYVRFLAAIAPDCEADFLPADYAPRERFQWHYNEH